MGTRTQTTVDGQQLSLSNLDKVMYPERGFTKRDVINYYMAVSSVLLPHVTNRAVTRIRYPDGTGAKSFYEKNAPSHTPDWVRTTLIDTPGSSKGRAQTNFVVVEDVPTLVWLANLAALELHAYSWLLGTKRHPDRIVADLDPGEGSGWTQCVEVALILRERLERDGLTTFVKSSGKKGLHIFCPISGEQSHDVVSDYARSIAYELQDKYSDLIVAKMLKKLRTGKVFIDWSQNNAAKTTVSPYSLRNLTEPTVSTPMRWDEVESSKNGQFTPEEVLDRIAEHGDLFAAVGNKGPKVPEL